MAPKISIVMPCFNQGAYIDDAIDSVNHQTMTDIEIVVVDDASTDPATKEKLKCIKGLQSANITVELLAKNVGVSAARNIGANLAKGEFLVFLDADDKLHPEFIQRCFDVISKTDKCNFVTSDVVFFERINRRLATEEYSIKKLLARNIFPVTGLLRRDEFMLTEGFDETMKCGLEDWEFWIRFLKKGGIVKVVHQDLFFYRIKKQSKNVEALQNIRNARARIVERNADIFACVGFLDPVELFEYRLISMSNDYKIGSIICKYLRILRNLF